MEVSDFNYSLISVTNRSSHRVVSHCAWQSSRALMIVLCANIFNTTVTSPVGHSQRTRWPRSIGDLRVFPLGRSEMIKKYGFLPSKSQLRSSSSESDSSDSDDEQGSMLSTLSQIFRSLHSFLHRRKTRKSHFVLFFSFQWNRAPIRTTRMCLVGSFKTTFLVVLSSMLFVRSMSVVSSPFLSRLASRSAGETRMLIHRSNMTIALGKKGKISFGTLLSCCARKTIEANESRIRSLAWHCSNWIGLSGRRRNSVHLEGKNKAGGSDTRTVIVTIRLVLVSPVLPD